MAPPAAGASAPPAAGASAPPAEPPYVFLDMPCDLISCLGPVASTPGYAEEMDGTQCLCRAARDDTMLGAATANLTYTDVYMWPRSRLGYACHTNNEERVQWLLDCGAVSILASTDPAYGRRPALVRRLALHPLVDATQALAAAAGVGATELVAPLVARGAQLEAAVPYFEGPLTALHAAAAAGHGDMVAALLAAGAAVDPADVCGRTPLVAASKASHVAAMLALLAAGADINARDEGMRDREGGDGDGGVEAAGGGGGGGQHRGVSAAVDAASSSEGAPAAAYLCSLPAADPSAHIAAACALGDVARVTDFLARGADVHERTWFGETCLAVAANREHVEVVRLLLTAGADPGALDHYRAWSPLTRALPNAAILALLLEKFQVAGEEARQRTLNGALYAALQECLPDRTHCVCLLLGAGAHPDWSAAHVSWRDIPDDDVPGSLAAPAECFREKVGRAVGGRYSMLSVAVSLGNVAAFRLLLVAGARLYGLDREATPEEEIRRHCEVPGAVPALLAALEDAQRRDASGGGRSQRWVRPGRRR